MITIRFSISEKDADYINRYAAAKGLKRSDLARMALFQYVAKYPPKGPLATLHGLVDNDAKMSRDCTVTGKFDYTQ